MGGMNWAWAYNGIQIDHPALLRALGSTSLASVFGCSVSRCYMNLCGPTKLTLFGTKAGTRCPSSIMTTMSSSSYPYTSNAVLDIVNV